MKLSKRLEAVLSFVERGRTAADVGTDHGHIPVELVRRNIVEKAVAMDVRKGPLSRAEEHIRLAGLSDQIETRLSDGVTKLLPGEAERVIIAGMGGELILKILAEGRHVWDSVGQWVLSPQSEISKVREWLPQNGFMIQKETMVYEDGKYYVIMDVRRGEDREPQAREGELLYGRYLITHKNPVLLKYLKEEEAKLAGFLSELAPKADVSERVASRISEIKKQLEDNREVQHEMQGNH